MPGTGQQWIAGPQWIFLEWLLYMCNALYSVIAPLYPCSVLLWFLGRWLAFPFCFGLLLVWINPWRHQQDGRVRRYFWYFSFPTSLPYCDWLWQHPSTYGQTSHWIRMGKHPGPQSSLIRRPNLILSLFLSPRGGNCFLLLLTPGCFTIPCWFF